MDSVTPTVMSFFFSACLSCKCYINPYRIVMSLLSNLLVRPHKNLSEATVLDVSSTAHCNTFQPCKSFQFTYPASVKSVSHCHVTTHYSLVCPHKTDVKPLSQICLHSTVNFSQHRNTYHRYKRFFFSLLINESTLNMQVLRLNRIVVTTHSIVPTKLF